MIRRTHSLLVGLLGASAIVGCVGEPSRAPGPISIVAVGDAGYHYDYLEAEDLEPRRDLAAYLAHEREDWIEDKRPIAEFKAPPPYVVPANGTVIAASGLHAVARAMHTQCAQAPRCDFGLMLGDNIYPKGATLGTDGQPDAERFRKIFAEPYGALFADRNEARMYVVLGNHDWKTSREGALAQAAYHAATRPFYMDGLFYSVIPPGLQGEVEIFAVDTHVLLAAETVYEDALADDGSELLAHEIDAAEAWAKPSTPGERDMARWLEQALARSDARWKIVIGHHPLWSSAGSKYEQARVLRRVLLPTLCRYADIYIAGHDHTLELHTDDCREVKLERPLPPLPQVVSGAGSKQRGLNSNFMRAQSRAYPQLRTLWARGMLWGFAQIVLEGERATVRFVSTPDDESGRGVVEYEHQFELRTGAARSGRAQQETGS